MERVAVLSAPSIEAKPWWMSYWLCSCIGAPLFSWRCAMLSKPDYFANARECLRCAGEAKSEADREALIEMAKLWTLLASQKLVSDVAETKKQIFVKKPL